jgi:hypothetical protein
MIIVFAYPQLKAVRPTLKNRKLFIYWIITNNILSRVRGSVTNNIGFWSGRMDLLALLLQLHFKLQSLITAHNRRLPRTHSVSFLDYERLPFQCSEVINSCDWPIYSFTNWFTLLLSNSVLWFTLPFVKVTLRLAVYSLSVRLGVKPLETHDKRFFFNWTLAVIVLM